MSNYNDGILSGYLLAFDLDGTLVDTAPDIIGSLNEILARKGVSGVDLSDAQHLVGRGARALIQRGFALAGLELRHADEDIMFNTFLEIYASRIDRLSRPFEGVERTLDALSAMGATHAVCTNKPQGLSELLLEKLGLKDRFVTIKGADAVPFKKPDAAHLKACADAAGLPLTKTLLVGDSDTDFKTSRNAGVPSILVSFGYSDPPVTTLSPHALIDHFDQLPPAVLSAFNLA
jgi:phosphoglycolate phosphatase